MSYTVTITEVQQGVTVTANTDLVTVTETSQPITVLVNAVEFATGVTNATINGAGNLIITLSNSTQLDAGQVVTSSTYGNTTVAAYLPTYSGSIGAATEIVSLTANAGAQSNQITGANAAIVTANTAMKSYVDAVTTAWTSNAGAQANQIAGANAAIITANTAMKNYVDAQTGAVTTAWTANAGAQANQIAGANAAIVTANTALKAYTDAQITTTQSWVTGANAAIVTANVALKGYVDQQFTNLTNGAPAILDTLGEIATSLGNNASLSTTLLNSIAGSNAAIVTANTALKLYVDTQDSAVTSAWTSNAGAQADQIAGANAAIVTANTALKAYTDDQITTANTALKSYVDTQDSAVTSAWTSNAGVQADAITALQSNAGAQANQITGANAVVATLQANVGSFYTWANTNFGTSSYANANVASFLPVYAGNIAANAVTRNAFAWQFNTDGSESFPSATTVATAAGKMWYDDTTGTWNAGMGGGNITQQIGEEIFVYGKASATITDSPLQLIYKTGTVGASGVVTFAPTVAGITDTNLILGCATEAIALNAFGRVTSYGLVRNITTTGSVYGETWADDDDIYYNPATGGLTNAVPTAPGLKVYIGTVVNAGSGGSGSFFVDIGAAGSLNSLSDVQTATNTAGQVLSYSSSSGYWKNTSLTAGSGIDITTYTNGNITIAGTYSNANVTSYLPTYSGSLAASSDIIALYANAGAQSDSIAGANASIVTANTALKSYVDAQDASVTSAWTANAATQQGQIDAKVNTASLATVATTGSYSDLINTPTLYSDTNTAAYLAGGITVGNIASTSGYFWANGTAYSTGTSFTGNLVTNSLTASGTGRILANASPQANVTQISSYTQGAAVTTTPVYTAGNLTSANQAVIAAFNGNINFLTNWAAGTRNTIGVLGYLGVTATSANTAMNTGDRIRPLVGGLDLNLNGKSWGLMSSASNTLTPIAVNGQTLNVYGTGNMGQAAGIALGITITPVGGSINAQYATSNFSSIAYNTAGATYTASNIQYARLYTGSVTATANLTVANAIALHTFSGWTSSNVSLVTNAYTVLNEDTRSTITTAGNINIANNATTTGFIKFAVFTVAQITAVVGSAGQMAAVSNGTGKNNGAMAYWDVTNTRWSWVSDDTAVS